MYIRRLRCSEHNKLRRVAKRGTNSRVANRARMILMSSRGETVSRIAEVLDFDATTVARWMRRFEENGIEGLDDQPRSGAPRRADEKYTERLMELVATDPQKIDPTCPWGTWTIDRLLERMKHEGYPAVSDDTVRRVLHARDYAFLRPKLHVKNKQDPAEVERFKRKLGRVKRGWTKILAQTCSCLSTRQTSI
jgi:transposase